MSTPNTPPANWPADYKWQPGSFAKYREHAITWVFKPSQSTVHHTLRAECHCGWSCTFRLDIGFSANFVKAWLDRKVFFHAVDSMKKPLPAVVELAKKEEQATDLYYGYRYIASIPHASAAAIASNLPDEFYDYVPQKKLIRIKDNLWPPLS